MTEEPISLEETQDDRLPMIPLRGMTVIPGTSVQFDVSREKSIKAVETAMKGDRRIFLVMQLVPETASPKKTDLYRIGCEAEILQVMQTQKGVLRVIAKGLQKGFLEDLTEEENGLFGTVIPCEAEETLRGDENLEEAFLRALKELFREYTSVYQKIPQDAVKQILEEESLYRTMNRIMAQLPVSQKQKQLYLEEAKLRENYDSLCRTLASEMEISRLQARITEKVKKKVDKNQRDYILREQMKAIREELGEESSQSDADRYTEEVEKLQASEEVKEQIRKEIRRFRAAVTNPAESSVLRGYLETLLEMPWDKMTVDSNDIRLARRILQEDHYGLEKVKERILEFLSVRILNPKGDSPILCLVGPPGTGKTSIARSIASCMNRKYVRISLGGVRDEAEIRGHRRTYVGALPGRIAVGIKDAGVKNPVMLLDEIDKAGTDARGDTASALLEVLDSEQNRKFKDHYLEIPIDLSDVFFIATANDLQGIPKPLLDRMEVIEISSYTENEKFHIARNYLVEKQKKKNGIGEKQLRITDEALKNLIHGYTLEAGVRSLERQIGALCRKAAVEILEKNRKEIRVTPKNLENYMGPVRYRKTEHLNEDQVGIVNGLAWTSVGGVTLEVEVAKMPGTGAMILTGSLGDVMKESARTALSYVRSVTEEELFSKTDFHIHIPEGAVPKDGPSAGITMATALYSSVRELPVRADAAMTGEVTLTGRILPIGGLKEKLLAAQKSGMKLVLVPEKNRKDVKELSDEILEGMEIRFVSRMTEVLEAVIIGINENVHSE